MREGTPPYQVKITRASARHDERPHEDAERRTYTQETARGPEEWDYWMVEVDDIADIFERFGPSVVLDEGAGSYPTADDVDHPIDFQLKIYDGFIE